MTASYRTVAPADTYRPKRADLFELKRRMIGIDEKQSKLFVGLLGNGLPAGRYRILKLGWGAKTLFQ